MSLNGVGRWPGFKSCRGLGVLNDGVVGGGKGYDPGWDLMTTGGVYSPLWAITHESYSFKSLRPRIRIFTGCLLSVIKRSQLYFYCPNLVKQFSVVKPGCATVSVCR